MNPIHRLLILTATLFATLPLHAQPPAPDDPQAPPPPPGQFPDTPPRQGQPTREGRPHAPLHQWMNQLREQDPAEFERLQELRLRDPEAFRTHVREQLQARALERLRRERPAIHDAFMNLPEEDRRWLAERLMRPGPGPGGPDAPPPGDDGPRRDAPAIDRDTVRAYKRATSDAERAPLRAELARQLGDAYDQQLAERQRQLAEAEEKIAAIRAALAAGEAGKQAFIEQKLDAWLKHNDRPPPPRD